MHYRQFLSGAVAVAFGAQGVFGINHGEISEYDGKNVRWQELAEGIFTGVPEEEWDENLHKRANVEWDIDEIVTNSNTSAPSHNTPLGSRDLHQQCKAAGNCIKHGTQYVLLLAVNTWISVADYAANGTPGKDLMEFLNQPFVANAAGVAVAGVVSGQINEATKKECSTNAPESSQADIIGAAVEAVLAKDPQAQEISVDVSGPSGTLKVKVKAGAPNTTPALSC